MIDNRQHCSACLREESEFFYDEILFCPDCLVNYLIKNNSNIKILDNHIYLVNDSFVGDTYINSITEIIENMQEYFNIEILN